jgi:hypothetical protein
MRMLSIGLFCLALLLLGCESNEKKYERLQSELYAAQLPLTVAEQAARKGQPQCPDLTTLTTKAYLDACTDRLAKARTRAALVQREMNKFMGSH